jgi:uncharacterized protein involved in response to NO
VTAAIGSLPTLLEISALLWIGGFGLFALRYGPMLLAPRADAGRNGG